MAIILCLETATTNCSVALSVNGSVTALKEDYSNQYSHAERLHVFIEEVLHKAKVEKSQLDAIAVSKGPGSYTGLRIGVSAAKGLCFALDIPLISVPTLDSLALKVDSAITIVPMLDARRMEVYSAVYAEDKIQVRETLAEILDVNSFEKLLAEGETVFIGNGVAKFQEICSHPNAVFMPDELPSAKEQAVLAEEKFNANLFEDVAYFEPYYLKDFKAG